MAINIDGADDRVNLLVRNRVALGVLADGQIASTRVQASYPTRADVAASAIDESSISISVRGYTTENDGGGAQYKAVTSEPSHQGKIQSADGQWWELDVEVVRPQMLGGFISGATNEANSLALQYCCDYLGTAGGLVELPGGTYTLTAPSATQVAADEGDCVQLTSSHGNVAITGQGDATVIKPASNKLVLFSCFGNTSLSLSDIHFDNSDNGILQNQFKPSPRLFTPNEGVAGYGNRANAVVTQHDTASVYMRGIRVTDFHTLHYHRGVSADDTVTAGDIQASDITILGGCFGFLTQQPNRIMLSNVYGEDIVQSITSNMGNDPGHILYQTTGGTGRPVLVSADHVQCERCESSPLKCNKAEVAIFPDWVFDNVAGGVECRRIERLTIDGGAGRFTNFGGYANVECVLVVDCGETIVSDCVFDQREVNARGINVNVDNDNETYQNQGVVIENCTFMIDASQGGGQGNGCVVMNGQDDGIIRDCTVRVYSATNPTSNPYFDFNDCTNCFLINPVHKSIDGATYERLVNMDADCTGTKVFWNDRLVEFTPSGNTIIDNGTGTYVVNQAIDEGTYTPTVTFATPGDFAPTYGTQRGLWRRQGDWVEVWGELDFDTNAYTTASGALRISFSGVGEVALGGGSGGMADWPVTLGAPHRFSTSAQMTGRLDAGESYFQIRESTSGGGGSTVGTGDVPASTTGFVLTFYMRFKRA